MPDSLLKRANKILIQLENKDVQLPTGKVDEPKVALTKQADVADKQLALFDTVQLDPKYEQIIEQLKKLNLMAMTPMDVMNQLYEWQRKIQSGGQHD